MEPVDHLLYDLWLLLRPGIGPRSQQNLLRAFGSSAGVYTATREELLRVPGIGRKLADGICAERSLAGAETERDRCREAGVRLIPRDHPEYPEPLREMPDPPLVLYRRGTLEPRDRLAVAMVGSRSCTEYGRETARKIASGLASAGVTIVSGLARGIDGCAHRGALAAGGRTIAVTATGMSSVYPPEHADLAREVAGSGAVLCEVPFLQKPVGGLFPQRNRIISGLSQAVVVIEANRKSGSLHTARHANEQGRDVLVVPGRVDSPASEGSHDLLRDGAILVRHADDVLQSLGPLAAPVEMPVRPTSESSDPSSFSPEETRTVQTPRELTLNDQERLVLEAVGLSPSPIDAVLRSVNLEDSRVLSTLTVLEMKRFIRRLPGGMLVRVP